MLTVKGGEINRMVELKSSGGDAQVQPMGWNQWETTNGMFRDRFWPYPIGYLYADFHDAGPFVRAVYDPIGTLAPSEAEDIMREAHGAPAGSRVTAAEN